MALRNTESRAAEPAVTTAAESREGINSPRPNMSRTPSETERLDWLTTYVLVVTSTIGHRILGYTVVHWGTLEYTPEYTGLLRSTPEYISPLGAPMQVRPLS